MLTIIKAFISPFLLSLAVVGSEATWDNQKEKLFLVTKSLPRVFKVTK